MATAKAPIVVFDEKEIAKSLFELLVGEGERSPRSGVFSNWEQGYFHVLRFVLKYMIKELGVDPIEAETLIYKYVAYVGYLYAKNNNIKALNLAKKKGKEFTDEFVYVDEFDKQSENVVTLDFLRSRVADSSSAYVKHFNLGRNPAMVADSKDDKGFENGLDDKAHNKFANGIPFFLDGTNIFDFAENGIQNMRFDMLVAEANNAPDWMYFYFEVAKGYEKDFLSNKYEAENSRTISLSVIPFIVNELFTNWKTYSPDNGKNIKVNEPIDMKDIGYYSTALYTNHARFDDIDFLDSGCLIMWSQVKAFRFKFKGKDICHGDMYEYSFSPSGICRLDKVEE